MPLDLTTFAVKWQQTQLTEKSAYQQHFRDLCEALGVPHPTEEDLVGSHYAFEKAVTMAGGGLGFVDVWKRDAFAFEYKLPGGDLNRVYRQLNEYHEDLYEVPFEYVKHHVKPLRDNSRDERMRRFWWIHGRSRPALRAACATKSRCIVTPEVAKHRLFAWIKTDIIPDHKLHVIARDDDYFFGALHSHVHELWTIQTCSWMGKGNDPSYNSATTFDTFPFPGHRGPNPPRPTRPSSGRSPTPPANSSACAMPGSTRPEPPRPT